MIYIKGLQLGILCLIGLVCSLGVGDVSASSASNVQITSAEVTAHGHNSYSKGWYHVTADFNNYCPFCGRHGTLIWNPKGTPEGEFTCGHCDADYCICGRCKATGSGVYLTPFNHGTIVNVLKLNNIFIEK